MRYRRPTTMRSANHRKRPTHEPRPLVGGPGSIWIVWGRLYRDMDVLMLDHDEGPRPRALPQRVARVSWDRSYEAINRMLGEEPRRCSVWTVSGGLPTLGKRR
jgi:hypothetical protein